jgi:hypothetical protein
MMQLPHRVLAIMGAGSRSAHGRRHERRTSDRPREGDTKPCPNCGVGQVEFSERYRIDDGGFAPAWVCDNPRCGLQSRVRDDPAPTPPAPPKDLIQRSAQVIASARRTVMRGRAKNTRARKQIEAHRSKKET